MIIIHVHLGGADFDIIKNSVFVNNKPQSKETDFPNFFNDCTTLIAPTII